MAEPSNLQKLVFGSDVKLHPVTGLPIETGRGALEPDQQAHGHLRQLEAEHGKELPDMRRRLGIATTEDLAKAAAETMEADRKKLAREQKAYAALEEKEAAEAAKGQS